MAIMMVTVDRTAAAITKRVISVISSTSSKRMVCQEVI